MSNEKETYFNQAVDQGQRAMKKLMPEMTIIEMYDRERLRLATEEEIDSFYRDELPSSKSCLVSLEQAEAALALKELEILELKEKNKSAINFLWELAQERRELIAGFLSLEHTLQQYERVDNLVSKEANEIAYEDSRMIKICFLCKQEHNYQDDIGYFYEGGGTLCQKCQQTYFPTAER